MKKNLFLIFLTIASQAFADQELSEYARKGAFRLVQEYKLQDGDKALIYDYNLNRVYLIHAQAQGREIVVDKNYIASGGRGGVNNTLKSGGTPPGVHKIFKKQGADFALNQTFDASKYGYYETRVTPTQGYEDWKSDFVMTRILRLQGLEGEKNNNSVKRSILFHGTQEEGLMGYHESAGCIRMLNEEVIEVFDQVKEGTLVNIVYESTQANRIPSNKRIKYNESLSTELVRLVSNRN